MVPNPTYSGPVKPTIKKFVELPFTSDSAEFNALVGGKVNVGYLPVQDITASDQQPARGRGQQPPAEQQVQPRSAVQLVDQLLPVQLQLHR